MSEAMTGQHVGHLLVKPFCSDRVGAVPFRLDKVDMAIPKSGCQDHAFTGYGLEGPWYNDLVRAAYFYNFPVPDQDGAIFNVWSRRGWIDPGAYQGDVSATIRRLAKNGACGEVKSQEPH